MRAGNRTEREESRVAETEEKRDGEREREDESARNVEQVARSFMAMTTSTSLLTRPSVGSSSGNSRAGAAGEGRGCNVDELKVER